MARSDRPPPTLQSLIDASGLALQDICKQTGMAERSFWALRHGLVANPRSTTVSRLASVLRTDVDTMRAALAETRRKAAK